MQAIVIGFAVMVLYGVFLLVRAMRLLYRAGEKRLVAWVGVFMVIAPLLLLLSELLPEENPNLWVILPVVILLLLWLCAGYFLESYRKQKLKLREMGLDKRPVPPPGLLRKNALVLCAGLAVWLYGAFIGIDNATIEMCLLCISVFLLASSIGTFWKYRKF